MIEDLCKASGDVISECNSDAIILGCAGFVNVDAYIQNKLETDIIDGVAVSLLMADIYAKYEKTKSLFEFGGLDLDKFINQVLNHRSIRNFDDRKVNEDTINKIFEAINRTPTSCGLQQASIIRVCDKNLEKGNS